MHRLSGTSTGAASGNSADQGGTAGTTTSRQRRRRCLPTSVTTRRAATRKSWLGSRQSALRTLSTGRASQRRARPTRCPIVRRRTSKAGRCTRQSHDLRRCRHQERCCRRSQVRSRMHSYPRGSSTDRRSLSRRTHRANRQRRTTAATPRVALSRPAQDIPRRVTTSCPTVRRCTSKSGRCSKRSHGPRRRRRQGRSRLHSHVLSRMHSTPRGCRTDRKPHIHQTHRARRQQRKTGNSPAAAPKRPTEDWTNRDDGKCHRGFDNKGGGSGD
jgi:hypothetical protein